MNTAESIEHWPQLLSHRILYSEFREELYAPEIYRSVKILEKNATLPILLYLSRHQSFNESSVVEGFLDEHIQFLVRDHACYELACKTSPSSKHRELLAFEENKYLSVDQLSYSAVLGNRWSLGFIKHAVAKLVTRTDGNFLFGIRLVNALGIYASQVLDSESFEILREICSSYIRKAAIGCGLYHPEPLLYTIYFLGLGQSLDNESLRACVKPEVFDFVDPILLYFLGLIDQAVLLKRACPNSNMLRHFLD